MPGICIRNGLLRLQSFCFGKSYLCATACPNSQCCDTLSGTREEFVAPSLWRWFGNLIGQFFRQAAPQTRIVVCQAMPQSHVAPHREVELRTKLPTNAKL